MNRASLLALLSKHAGRLKAEFGLGRLSVFGSAARDELREGSDVDILVQFVGAPTFDAYMDLKFELEALFQMRVDLVTAESIRPRMRPIVERDLIDVA
jgi:hypothetical protein